MIVLNVGTFFSFFYTFNPYIIMYEKFFLALPYLLFSPTIMQNMFIYDIVFHLWGHRQRFSIYKRLPLLFERSFRHCSVQNNYTHYVKQFYRRILLCIKIVDSSPSVEQLLNVHC